MPFKDDEHKHRYIVGARPFPNEELEKIDDNGIGCSFIKRLMAPIADNRPKAVDCVVDDHDVSSWFTDILISHDKSNKSSKYSAM